MSMRAETTSLDEQVKAGEEEWLELWTRGPVRTRWEGLPPQVGDPAPDLELLDSNGETVSLSRFWQDGPALLLFWRFFGCSCGAQRSERLREEYEDYVAAGARVALIGQAEPWRAAVFADEQGIQCAVLCDPDYEAYQTYGLLEGQPTQILFDAPPEFLRHERETGAELQRQRREQGKPLVDSPWQLPGEFVVNSDGTIALAYRYQYCEDFPNPLVLVSAIRESRQSKHE